MREQKRIAAILDQADALRRLRRQALDRLNGLGQAVFREIFGTFEDGFENWRMARLEDLIDSTKIGAVRGAAEMSDDAPVPYLRMDSIGTDGQLRLTDLKNVHATEAERTEFGLKPGDLLFNTRNSRELVGKIAVVREPFAGIYNNNILRCRFGCEMTADFLDAFLRTRKGAASLESIKSGTTSVFAIYQKSFLGLTIPCPPRDMQDIFSQRLAALFKEKQHHETSAADFERLFSSLQSRAFQGEL